MEEKNEKSLNFGKIVAILVTVMLIMASLYLINTHIQQPHQVVLPHVKLNITSNNTQTIIGVIEIDYKYSIDYFRLENMLVSVYTLESSENNSDIVEYGDYYHKGPLSDILNNETSPLTFYDIDNDNVLGIGDIFISDLEKLTNEEIESIGLSLWIVVDGEELSCGV